MSVLSPIPSPRCADSPLTSLRIKELATLSIDIGGIANEDLADESNADDDLGNVSAFRVS